MTYVAASSAPTPTSNPDNARVNNAAPTTPASWQPQDSRTINELGTMIRFCAGALPSASSNRVRAAVLPITFGTVDLSSPRESSPGWLLKITGRDRLLDGAPVLQRSIALRNPYVDALSEVQVRLLRRLRALPPDSPDRDLHRRLVQLSVNGVAAGLQNTG